MGRKLAGSSRVTMGTHPLVVKRWSWVRWASLPLSWDLIPECWAWEANVKPKAVELVPGNQSNLVCPEILKAV